MRNSNEQSLGEAIREFLQIYNLDEKLNETSVVKSWEKVAGKLVARHTQGLYIRNKVLFVRIDSPALKNELNYNRGKIVTMLNKAVKKEVIEDIVFQ